MKKGIISTLLLLMVISMVTLSMNDIVYAAEPEITWLMKDYDTIYYFEEGLAMVSLNNKWGYIDKTGKEVFPLKYNMIDEFYEG